LIFKSGCKVFQPFSFVCCGESFDVHFLHEKLHFFGVDYVEFFSKVEIFAPVTIAVLGISVLLMPCAG